PELAWSRLAVEMCRRRTGVGSDGLLVLLNSKTADFRMRMFNPDGSEDHCGNGLRCTAAYYSCVEGVPPNVVLRVETSAGERSAVVLDLGPPALVKASMGRPELRPSLIPANFDGETVVRRPLRVLDRELEVTSLSVGTTHTVVFAPEALWERDFALLSPAIEVHPAYPERTSVLWTDVIRPDRILVRIWERGVGETLGCGTGACAVAVAARLAGFTVAPRIEVVSRGGSLYVEWDGEGDVYLTGPARFVFKGEWPPASKS
ncbi:MAG: diaminopimelate epimerase, partial [Armatimonadota bacterium]